MSTEGVKAKSLRRLRRKRGLRKRLFGTAERPRLAVYRSHLHIYAQIINDERGVTICQAGTRNKDLRDQLKKGGDIEAAKLIGKVLADRAMQQNVKTVCFDRAGYTFHGRVKSLADAAREGGLQF